MVNFTAQFGKLLFYAHKLVFAVSLKVSNLLEGLEEGEEGGRC